jgi:hypothetical protein
VILLFVYSYIYALVSSKPKHGKGCVQKQRKGYKCFYMLLRLVAVLDFRHTREKGFEGRDVQ